MRRFIFVLCAFASSIAVAQTTNVSPSLYGRAASYSLDEIINASRGVMPKSGGAGNAVTKILPSAGRYVPYVGAVVLASGAVNSYFDFIYNQAQDAFKPHSLNEWWNQPVTAPVGGSWTEVGYNPSYFYLKCPPGLGNAYVDFRAAKSGSGLWYTTDWRITDEAGNTRPINQSTYGERAIEEAQAALTRMLQCQTTPPKSLDKWIEEHPEAGTELQEAMTGYLQTERGRPYLQFSPVPTKNQIYDYPVDPTEDCDKDGYPDADEVREGTGACDPTSQPKGQPYPIKTTIGTTRNPDGSTTKTTRIDYSDGSYKISRVTTRKEVIENPDGSVTTRTTTTYETTKYDKDGVPVGNPDVKQEQTEETTPAPEPEPKNEAECVAAGGTWANDACTMPDKTPEEKCAEAGRVWDDINQTCTQQKKDDDVTNECGDFSIPRLLKYTGAYLHDVVFPCEDLEDMFRPLLEAARDKYPFSMLKSVNGNLISAPSSGDRSAVLPNKFGPFTLDWSWLSPLLTVVGLLFKGFSGWLAVDLVFSRMWGQVVIK